ncbi:uncharacterized protein PFL1_02569 [Pseudozyma flocculosa PF-1]|uniref:Bromo domain-containing protein n=1 Tax=Pseudozyma flocculosa PF-1 TaxID=1277687 RepID=A0A061HGY0_9BASI|nr:uncharacterized protein PFL1_02569 [Pseudozyma flocculosa PF-1]EPQ29896.1 hypothetical protein PFL1_02569 [Pseudozyma flocculosa PF-1]
MSNPPAGQRRRLQIKLPRPKPPPSEPVNGGARVGLRISLKRRPSRTAPDEEDEDEDDEDHGDSRSDGSGDSQAVDEDEDEDDAQEQQEGESDDGRSAVGNRSVDGEEARDDSEQDSDEDEDEDEDEEDDDDDDNGSPSRHQAHGRREEDMDQDESDDGGRTHHSAPAMPAIYSSGSRSRPIKRLRSKGLYDALPKLIDNLKRRDSYKFFWEPVDLEEVPNYLDFIEHPMDLGTMEKKVQDRLYSHMDEFKRDFQLVVGNAQTFNPPGTLFHGEGRKLQHWGTRAIEREGMAVNDNGRAGVKGDLLRRSREASRLGSVGVGAGTSPVGDAVGGGGSRDSVGAGEGEGLQPDTPTLDRRPRKSLRMALAGNAGLDALFDAARLKPGDEARAAAALALATAGRSGGGASLDLMDVDMDQDGRGIDSDGDEQPDAAAEENAGGRRSASLRERSATADQGGTVLGGRRRLATVTGTPLAAFAREGAAMAKSTPASKIKPKHRLGPVGTPKRLAASFSASRSGTATPSSMRAAVTSQAATAAAAAALAAASGSASAVSAPAASTNFVYAPDGSIDPNDIDDLHSFFTLRDPKRPILVPTIESLQPLAFVPQQHSDRAATVQAASKKKDKDRDRDEKDGAKEGEGDKEKEQEKEKETETEKADKADKEKDKDKASKADKTDKSDKADKADKTEKADKADKTEKADKDPLSTLPPVRPGVPDALFTAIAPSPEPYAANYSHDTSVLPDDLAAMPFHVPSGSLGAGADAGAAAKPSLPTSYENVAYAQALLNEGRPKKLKDKELEKEKEYTEDWTQYRPHLGRLLEARDLGPWSTLPGPPLTTTSGGGGGGLKLRAEGEQGLKQRLEASLDGRGVDVPELSDLVMASAAAAAAAAVPAAGGRRGAEMLAAWSERTLRDKVWKGALGEAYARSVAEFIGGAIDSPFVWQEGDPMPASGDLDAAAGAVDAGVQLKSEAVEDEEMQPRNSPAPTADMNPATATANATPTPAPAPGPTVSQAIPSEALLPMPLADYVAKTVLDPLSCGMLGVMRSVEQHLVSQPTLTDATTSLSAKTATERLADGLDDAKEAEEMRSMIEHVLST